MEPRTRAESLKIQSREGDAYFSLLGSEGWKLLVDQLINKYMSALQDLRNAVGEEKDMIKASMTMKVIEEIFSLVGQKMDFGEKAKAELIKKMKRKTSNV